jgi:hypothetical protein
MANLIRRANDRIKVLNTLDELCVNDRTTEKEMHRAIEVNWWLLGSSREFFTSNQSLKTVVKSAVGSSDSDGLSTERPDLFLGESPTGEYLLVEFKRPSVSINRDHISQALKYRDRLLSKLGGKAIRILMLGKGRVQSMPGDDLGPGVEVASYAACISTARRNIEWLINSLT